MCHRLSTPHCHRQQFEFQFQDTFLLSPLTAPFVSLFLSWFPFLFPACRSVSILSNLPRAPTHSPDIRVCCRFLSLLHTTRGWECCRDYPQDWHGTFQECMSYSSPEFQFHNLWSMQTIQSILCILGAQGRRHQLSHHPQCRQPLPLVTARFCSRCTFFSRPHVQCIPWSLGFFLAVHQGRFCRFCCKRTSSPIGPRKELSQEVPRMNDRDCLNTCTRHGVSPLGRCWSLTLRLQPYFHLWFPANLIFVLSLMNANALLRIYKIYSLLGPVMPNMQELIFYR